MQFELLYTVESRFNKMPEGVAKLVRFIENLDLTNLRENNQGVRKIDGLMIIFSIFLNHYNFFVV